MPYIRKFDRQHFAKLDEVTSPATAGELNYCLTRLVLGFLGTTPNYDSFNAAIGALECAKLELYRRRVAPYEDNKITENGDVV